MNQPLLAMIMLRQPTELSSLEERYAELFSGQTIDLHPHESGAFGIRAGEHDLALVTVEMPIPWSDLEWPCSQASHWPDAADEVRTHTAHVLVSTIPGEDDDPIDAACELTRCCAALAKSCGAVGIYWGAAGQVHATADFVEMARSFDRDYLPLYLWLAFRITPSDDRQPQVSTSGMAAFGLPDIDVPIGDRDVSQLQELAFNAAHYLLDNGPVLGDGHSFGTSAEMRAVVHHHDDGRRLALKLADEGAVQPGSGVVVGQPDVWHSPSPSQELAVVFEDDGDTGYLYAVDTSGTEQKVLDAMCIYNVDDRGGAHLTMGISWSADGLKALLHFDGHPEGIFDFDSRRGYCHTNFPPANPDWSEHDHRWSNEALKLFTEENLG